MRQLGMVGSTFRRAGQKELEVFTFPADSIESSVCALHRACGFLESVYIATCNRVEVVFVGDRHTGVDQYRRRVFEFFQREGVASGDRTPDVSAAAPSVRGAQRALHAYGGDGAAEHLFCVAAALDSMNPGEAQILGQVKAAYKRACDLELVGKRLTLLFEEAFEAAKHVRTETSLGEGTVSMVSLALGLIDSRLPAGRGGRMAVIGVGDMARQCGEILGGREGLELVFVNRTASRAEALAEQYGGCAAALGEFLRSPGRVDAIVTSTAATEPFLNASFFASVEGEAPLIVDLAIPPDTDARAAAAAGASLYDIDRLKGVAEENRKQREADLADARDILDQRLTALRRRVVDRDMGAVVRTIRRRYDKACSEGLDSLLSSGLGDLSQQDLKKIQRWARSFVNRCAHVPTVGLKRVAHEHGLEAVETFLEAVGERVETDDQAVTPAVVKQKRETR